MSRGQIASEFGRECEMPDFESGEYLWRAFNDIGLASSSSGGLMPILWSEVRGFAEATGAIDEPWEMQAIRQMSEAYVAERHQRNPLRISPMDRGKRERSNG